jgi:hypothetical protein
MKEKAKKDRPPVRKPSGKIQKDKDGYEETIRNEKPIKHPPKKKG